MECDTNMKMNNPRKSENDSETAGSSLEMLLAGEIELEVAATNN